MRGAICYRLYHLKNVKNTHGRVLLKVCNIKPATLLKVTLLHGRFSPFLNLANAIKSLKALLLSLISALNNVNLY